MQKRIKRLTLIILTLKALILTTGCGKKTAFVTIGGQQPAGGTAAYV